VSWQVQWTKRALRATAKLDRPTRERIVESVGRLATTGQGDVKRLKGEHRGLLRLRVGGWRVFFSKAEDRLLVIHAIRPRGDAY